MCRPKSQCFISSRSTGPNTGAAVPQITGPATAETNPYHWALASRPGPIVTPLPAFPNRNNTAYRTSMWYKKAITACSIITFPLLEGHQSPVRTATIPSAATLPLAPWSVTSTLPGKVTLRMQRRVPVTAAGGSLRPQSRPYSLSPA